MFTFDASWLMLILVVAPILGLVSVSYMTSSLYDTLPYRRELMNLPLYAYLYRRSDGDTDLPDRSMTATLLGLGFLYLCIIATFAPVANKILGIVAWLFTIDPLQALYVSFFLACIVTVVFSLFSAVKERFSSTSKRRSLLPIALLGIIFGGSTLVAMSAGIRLIVWHSFASVSLGMFCFIFFAGIAYSLAEKQEETGQGGLGLTILNIFLVLMSVGSLANILS